MIPRIGFGQANKEAILKTTGNDKNSKQIGQGGHDTKKAPRSITLADGTVVSVTRRTLQEAGRDR